MQALFGQLLIGLINGAFYAMLSLGLAVIFGLLNIINFTHGAQYMMGAFCAWFLLTKTGINYWWALLIAPIIVGAVGILIEKTMLARLYKLDHLYGLLLTFGLALVIQGLFRNEFGSSGLPYRIPPILTGGVNLGFMSFFVKASVEALKRFPVVNASVENNDIIYHEYFDIGVAVSTERGLMVPVLRDADAMSFADVEKGIANYATRARTGAITLEDLTGGTFSITNGGIFGSLMSTPIVNAPQSAILGMHKIQERPIVVNGQIAIRPMMYLAVTYDHRIIDGREAVLSLVAMKDALEDPARILLDI